VEKQTEGLVSRLVSIAKGIRYGSVGVELKIHDGRITSRTFSSTETCVDRFAVKEGVKT
jgi:hypothetical protein